MLTELLQAAKVFLPCRKSKKRKQNKPSVASKITGIGMIASGVLFVGFATAAVVVALVRMQKRFRNE